MADRPPFYERPSRIERLFGRVVIALLRLGLGPRHMRILEVRGRRSGRLHALPVDMLEEGGRMYLVAPRGLTEWARNVEASGEVTLRRGARVERYRVRPLSPAEKPAVLQAYLARFRREVQRYFPVAAGSPTTAFAAIAARYPAYELTPKG